jgi:hypothetical protein
LRTSGAIHLLEHVVGDGLAAGRHLEGCTVRTAKPHGVGEEPAGLLLRPLNTAEFEVTDGPDADRGEGSQLFLLQPGPSSDFLE